ncbi:glycine dehydrogenase (aminomethyl-transferring) [Rhodothalassium salexigens]|uniref:aminomethyl-transferring glycine dehydrogenase subunit GcvPA n=1 Tax=Rhodothalassium salexigens TaxID=1086 RepID=UPI001914A5D7|nr:aminomethyl-transferring glycine dehydrogenase subunit GcvPA [Rhodothalassium salexigens]MBK5912015.1 glycine dehydrogenase (aminomethyl-transferring) [Rhodothalassium salexigens]MBK5922173.1 glycine dehydrogenase (aminomethyl-transferring) [Rhodothalassium salexigens]
MRYLPHTQEDRREMLAALGVDHVDALFEDVPANALNADIDLPDHQSEMQVERAMARLAAKNVDAGSVPFFCGAGAYRHHVPATVDYVIQRGEFLTAYTPYQPEISQGTLQYLFEFQTQVATLLGTEVANASMWDGSTATAEAVLMARRITRRKKAVMAGGLHGHYADVVGTVTRFTDDAVTYLEPEPADPDAETQAIIDQIDDETSCVVVQSPNMFGHLLDLKRIAEAAHAKKALLIAVVTEVVSLGAITPPGDQGADIVVAEGQSLGNGLNFGGPYLGLFGTRQKYVRQMPGRVAGEARDADGRRGFVLTLSTREQHIRREKATSNICTNSGLCALAFTTHLSLLGEVGLRKLAMLNHRKAVELRDLLAGVPGVEVLNETFFNEFTLRLRRDAAYIVEALVERDVLGGVPVSRLLTKRDDVDNLLLVAVTETVTRDDMETLARELREALA